MIKKFYPSFRKMNGIKINEKRKKSLLEPKQISSHTYKCWFVLNHNKDSAMVVDRLKSSQCWPISSGGVLKKQEFVSCMKVEKE